MATHMSAGNAESSYANNSTIQKMGILKTRRILEETIEDMMQNDKILDCYKIADLGCSSGPNTLLAISNIIDAIYGLCMKKRQKSPELQVSLNDLFENDFNTVFKSLPSFYDKLRKEKGGEFVPKGIENNKGNIFIAKTSPPNVSEAYLKQFQKEFSTFLRSRSEEIVPNGRMILTFFGRDNVDPTRNGTCHWLELLAKSLNDMVDEGLVGEAELDSFNVPLYAPYTEDVKAIIKEDGSFTLDRLELFGVNWDPSHNDDEDKVFVIDKSGKFMAKTIRAILEPLLVSHFGFGNSKMDYLFEKFACHVGEHLAREKSQFTSIVISLTKK